MFDKENNEQLYKLTKASKLLGVQVRTLREWIKLGKIRAIKLQGCPMWFISQKEIDKKRGE